ncbi:MULTISPECIES: CopG family transcriptional regulator [unclassified Nodularia (in: cyanobacteria)]|uniref:ribbon-helix-helix domain-containing protein n=1 Tax=unclassified Nodularia (in: cyanobacteria) TaxID=2656917 RepID=UPI00188291CD|nr:MULTISPECIES: CopG family transcriptional regulator [unclassified Nodularia (in: cyanobacteria)]MBE9201529.1 ribbon-helix-helix protein, CopG family [Nodularia sp. LEGE 06071]MCC2694402.1 ribbon-helix-helix protein, CopG family [Nodularia sp. LEGE 04288]
MKRQDDQITIRIPADLKDDIAQLGEQKRMTKAEIIREALQEYFKNRNANVVSRITSEPLAHS